MCRSLFCWWILASLTFIVNGQEVTNYKETTIRFEVLSASLMNSEERNRKQSDNIGIDVSVKMRLSNPGRTTVFFYAYGRKSIVPVGNIVKETEKGLMWFTGLQSISEKPLGIDEMTLRSGDWLALYPEMAIEYESFDSSIHAGEKHAQTFFMRVGSKGSITQVLSDSYSVPTNAVKK